MSCEGPAALHQPQASQTAATTRAARERGKALVTEDHKRAGAGPPGRTQPFEPGPQRCEHDTGDGGAEERGGAEARSNKIKLKRVPGQLGRSWF